MFLNAQEKLQIPDNVSVSKADKFSGNKIYNHADLQRANPFKLYLSGQDSMRILILRCQYYGSGWIFFNRMVWLNDLGEKIEFNFESKQLNRQVGSGGYVYETGTIDLDYKQIEDLKLFLGKSSKVDVRFVGDKYYDTVFKEKKIRAALDMVEFFYTDNKAVELIKGLYEMEQKLKNN